MKVVKKVLSVLLTAIMLVGILPMAQIADFDFSDLFVNASAEDADAFAYDDIPDYKIWQADMYSQFFDNIFSHDNSSYGKLFYNELDSDRSFKAGLVSWETICFVASPGSTVKKLLTKKDYYVLALYELFRNQQETETSGVSEFNKKYGSLYGLVNNAYAKYIVNVGKMILSEDEIRNKEDINRILASLKTDNEEVNKILFGDENSEDLQLFVYGSKYAAPFEVAGDVFSLLETAGTVSDVIKKTSQYLAVREAADGTLDVLDYIRNDPSNPNDLRVAATEFYNCVNNSMGEICAAVESVADFAVDKVLDEFFDTVFKKIIEGNEVLEIAQFVAKSLKLLLNYLWEIDSIAGKYYQLKADVVVEDAISRCVSAMKDNYLSSKTKTNAVNYLRAVTLIEGQVLLDFDASIDLLQCYADDNNADRLVNGIAAIFGKTAITHDNVQVMIKTIEDLRDNKKYNYETFEQITAKKYYDVFLAPYADYLNAVINYTPAPNLHVDIMSTEIIEEEDLEYTVSDNKVTITGYIGRNGKYQCAAIPSEIEGLPVTAIAPRAFVGESFYRIIIPSTVKSIGSKAFWNHMYLNRIVICGEDTTIGYRAFGWEIVSSSTTLDESTNRTYVYALENSTAYDFAETTDGFHFESIKWNGVSDWPVSPDKNNVYHIYTANELKYIQSRVTPLWSFEGFTVKLENDIYLNDKEWMPIGSRELAFDGENNRYFSGSFDGNNHTVYGLNCVGATSYKTKSPTGLFSYVKCVSDCYYKNVTVRGSISGAGEHGGLVGNVIVDEGVTVDFENITTRTSVSNPVTIFDDGRGLIGGLIGNLTLRNDASINIADCRQFGNLSSGFIVAGGFVGNINATKTSNISFYRCLQNSVIRDAASYGYNSGTVGGFIGTAANGNYTIKECAVNGEIWFKGYGLECGGFIGRITPHSISMQDCENFAYIHTEHSNGNSGMGFVISGCYADNYDDDSEWVIRNILISSVCHGNGAYAAPPCFGIIVLNQGNEDALRKMAVYDSCFDGGKTSLTMNSGILFWGAMLQGGTVSDKVYNTAVYTSDELKTNHSLYGNWDFENTWTYADSGYPRLQAFDIEPCAEHIYSPVTTAPTCVNSGSIVYTCAVCKYTYTENLAALGHDDGVWNITSGPDENGLGTCSKNCTRCGTSLRTANYYCDTDNVCWLYEESENGIAVVGGFNDGNDEEFLTVPSYINSKPVIRLAGGDYDNLSTVKSLFLPATVISADSNAFASFESLERLTFPNADKTVYSKIEAEDTTMISAGSQTSINGNTCVSAAAFGFDLEVTAAGYFVLSANCDLKGSTLQLTVDGTDAGCTESDKGMYSKYTFGPLYLDIGTHSITFGDNECVACCDYFTVCTDNESDGFIINGSQYRSCSDIEAAVITTGNNIEYNCYLNTNAYRLLDRLGYNYNILDASADGLSFIEEEAYIVKGQENALPHLRLPADNTDVLHWSVTGSGSFTIGEKSRTIRSNHLSTGILSVSTDSGLNASCVIYVVPFEGCYEYTLFDCKLNSTTSELTITGYEGSDKDLIIPENISGYSVTGIGSNAISNKLHTVTLSKNITSVSTAAFNTELLDYVTTTNLKAIYVDPENTAYTSKEGILYSKDGKTLVRCPRNYEETDVTVEDGVEEIEENAFAHTWIEHVTLPDSLKYIYDSAFEYAELTSVELPDSLLKIYDSAFSHNHLEEITIPESVTVIQKNAFSNNSELKTINYNATKASTDITSIGANLLGSTIFNNNSSINEINIGANVQSIPRGMFVDLYTVPVVNIAAGSQLATIEDYAFHKTNSIVDVYYGNNYNDYKKINIKKGNTPFTNATLHCLTCDECIWNDGEITRTATCSKEGVMTYTCTVCGAERNETIEKTAHTPEVMPAVAATCKATGLTEGSKCSVCGEILVAQEETLMIDHTWNDGEITKTATCKEEGVKTFTCTVCGDTRTEIIGKIAHTPEVMPAVAATCKATGLTEGSKCSACGDILVAQEETPMTDHTWNEGEVTKPATCKEEGVKTFTCSSCGDTKTETIGKIDHTPEVMPAVAATCKATGLTEGSKCSVCGDILVAQEETPMIDHTWNDGEITKTATCKEEGVKTFTCSSCGDTRTETIGKTAHTPEVMSAVAATCKATGLTEGSKCSVCGDILVAQEETPMTDHTWNEGEVTKPATCKEEGVKTFTCSSCGDTKTETIGKIDHTPEVMSAVAATCKATGLTEGSKCSVCGDILVAQEETPVIAHTWNDGEITKAATCKEEGVKNFTCSSCGDTRTEIIGKIAHTPEVMPAVAATCKATGLTEGSKCSVCGDILVAQEETPMIAHTWNSGEITKAATCTEAGVKTFTCSACGDTKTENIKAIGHRYGSWETVKIATCTEEGLERRVCANDENHIETRRTPKLSHHDGSGDGLCDDCGASMETPVQQSNCACGQYHSGPFAGLIRFFHTIIYFFKNLFK